jgi:hypothetical protein
MSPSPTNLLLLAVVVVVCVVLPAIQIYPTVHTWATDTAIPFVLNWAQTGRHFWNYSMTFVPVLH